MKRAHLVCLTALLASCARGANTPTSGTAGSSSSSGASASSVSSSASSASSTTGTSGAATSTGSTSATSSTGTSSSAGSTSGSSTSGSTSTSTSGSGGSTGLVQPYPIGSYDIEYCQPGFDPGFCSETSTSVVADADRAYVVTSLTGGWALRALELRTGAVRELAEGAGVVVDLAQSDSQLYLAFSDFSQHGSLSVVDKDGGTAVPLASGNMVINVATDAEGVYWFSSFPDGGFGVLSMPLGGGAPAVLATTDIEPIGFALHDGVLYWGRWNELQRVRTDGGALPPVFDGGSYPQELAADDSYLYWYEPFDETVNRVSLNGGPREVLATGLPYLQAMAPTPAGVYVEYGGVGGMLADAGLPDGTLARIEPDGGLTVLVIGFECPEVGAVHMAVTDAGIVFPSSLDVTRAFP